MGDHSHGKNNLTVKMACTIQVEVFYWQSLHLYIDSVIRKRQHELRKPFSQLDCTVFIK